MKKEYKTPQLEVSNIHIDAVLNNTSDVNVGGTTDALEADEARFRDILSDDEDW